MKSHESPRNNKKSIRGDSSDSWPVWNRGIRYNFCKVILLYALLKRGATEVVWEIPILPICLVAVFVVGPYDI